MKSAPDAKPPPRSRLLRAGTWLARGLVALVVLLGLGLGLLHTSWAQQKLRARIEGRLGERVSTHASLGGLRFSLGSGLALEDLVIDGTDGRPALTIARVQVMPRWGRLLRGDLVLADLAVDTVVADLHGQPDGTTNLTGVFRSGKPLERIGLEHLALRGVRVSFDKPDGTQLVVDGVSLEGAVRAEPPHRTVNADLRVAIESLSLTRPDLVLRGTALGTHAVADLVEGSGPVAIGPTQGALVLEREGHAPYPIALSLASLRATLGPGELALAADSLELAVLTLAAAKIETRRSGEALAGTQSAHLERLVVSAEAVNRLAARTVLAGDLTVGVGLQGPPEALALRLEVGTPGGTLLLEGHGNVTQPLRSGDFHLSTRDLDVRKIIALETIPAVRIGVLDVKVQGQGQSRETARGNLVVHGEGIHTTIREHEPLEVRRLDLEASLAGGAVEVSRLEIEAVEQTVSANGHYDLGSHDVRAHVETKGSLPATLAKLRRAGIQISSSPVVQSLSTPGPLVLDVSGNTDKSLTVRSDRLALGVLGGGAQGRGEVVLVAGDPARGEKRFRLDTMNADVDVHGISLATLGKLRGKPLPVSGTVSGTVHVEGTASAPRANLDVTVKLDDDAGSLQLRGTLADGALQAHAQLAHQSGLAAELDVTGRQNGGTSRLEATGSVRVNADTPPLSLRASAKVAGPLTTVRSAALDWTLDLALPEAAIRSLSPRTAELGGTVQATLKAHGNRHDVFADLDLDVRRLQRGALGPLDADLDAHLGDAGTTLALATRLDDGALAQADASLDVSGRGLVAAARRGLNPNAHVRVAVPRRKVSSLLSGAPVPGSIGGELTLDGSVRDPKLLAAFDLQELTSLDGKPSHATVSLDGTLDQLTAKVILADALGLTITASPRAYLAAKKLPEGALVPIRAHLAAAPTPVDRVLPALGELEPYRGSQGSVSADFHANVGLRVGAESRGLESLDLRGPIAVEGGTFAIPGSARVIRQIGLSLIGQGEIVRLEKLEAHESDAEKKDRHLEAKGVVDVRARHAELELALRDVLLFGGNFGQADAPRASLSGAVQVRADLATAAAPATRVDVTVQELDLESPDRFARAHQPELLSVGDLVELGASGESGVGRLRRQKPVASTPKRGEKSLEVAVHIPKPIHLKQRPLELWAHGEVRIERFGEVRETTGTLTCERGTLLVGGVSHTLQRGEVRMSPEGPLLDLHFQHQPAPAALRDFATANGSVVEAHMTGVLGKQKLTVSGLADSLMDTLSINNGGRARVLTAPDLPASQTAQLPQTREIRLTAYMGANLPHLAVLTRMNTYANPYEHRFSYGRFQNLEAERYTQNGKWRMRTTTRSPVIGQSEGEVEYDRLFLNTPRVVSGVGLLGGTRVGGGPTVFWEWSSAD